MKMFQRTLCLLLVLVMCLGVLASCDNSNNTDPKDTSTNTETDTNKKDSETTTTPDDPDPTDTLDPSLIPVVEDSYDFNKQEYVVLSRASTSYEFKSDSGLSGNPVEQAVYERNEEVMERCNVAITVLTESGDWGDRDSFMTTVRNNALLPISEYDLIATHQAYLSTLSLEGLGLNFADMTNVDLTKRWWGESFYNDANVDGNIYIMYGDVAYTIYQYMMVIFFNEQMAENYGIDDLYDLVEDGDWTWETFKSYVTKVTTDPNATPDTVEYGFMTNGHSNRQWTVAFERDLCPMDPETGRRKIPLFMTDELYVPLQNCVDFILKTDQVWTDSSGDNSREAQNPVFISGRSLFYAQMLGQATVFKAEMDDEYGVLPFPKYDAKQSQYRTGVRDTMTGLLVPANCKDEEMAGTVLEMLSTVSYLTVTQEYYEEALKYQSFNDPQVVETLELIRTSLSPSFAAVYSFSLNYINSLVNGLIETNGTLSVATKYSQSSKQWQNLLTQLYATFDEMNFVN